MSNVSRPPATRALRAIVQPRTGSPLSIRVLSDEQLVRLAQWIKEGRSNELCAGLIKDYWGQCTNTKPDKLLDDIRTFRVVLLAEDQDLAANIDLAFDPLGELVLWLRELKALAETWNERAKADPTKEICDRADRLSRLYTETFQKYGDMAAKLGKFGQPALSPGTGKTWNVGQMNLIMGKFGGKEMLGFTEALIKAVEEEAKPIPSPKPTNLLPDET